MRVSDIAKRHELTVAQVHTIIAKKEEEWVKVEQRSLQLEKENKRLEILNKVLGRKNLELDNENKRLKQDMEEALKIESKAWANLAWKEKGYK